MSQPYVGEIRMFGGSFPPNGWAFCAGQTMAISENDTLFNLIGTTYGGDGQSTFNLPNLCGRVPVHQGTGPDGQTYQIGEMAGIEQVTLTTQQIPAHTHSVLESNSGSVLSPAGAYPGTGTGTQQGLSTYSPTAPNTALHPSTISSVGGSQPHENMQPYLAISFIISLFGIFPTQN